MARRGFLAELAHSKREQERAQRSRIRAHQTVIRDAERTRRAYEKAALAEEKERKRLYQESRAAEAESMNQDLLTLYSRLENTLSETLFLDDYFDIASLKVEPEIPPFQPGILASEEPPLALSLPSPPSSLGKLFPGATKKYEEEVTKARRAHQEASHLREAREQRRGVLLEEEKKKYDEMKRDIIAKTERRNQEVDAFLSAFEKRESDAIVSYFDMVLQASSYPDDFPRHTRLAFVPESKQLVLEYELPTIDVIPTAKSYKYVKARDEISEVPQAPAKRRSLYSSLIAQITLRTVHELFESDRSDLIDTIVFNGLVQTVDKTTGQPVSPCLVTVRTTRDVFERLDLGRVDPVLCLKGLNAGVSKNPAELIPVRPVLEFNMVDRRFIEETDVLSSLDQRPNLMDLSPGEFENLITNLFTKMGLETRLTQASRDGGVDCVAYDPRPIFGGKVIIQAKRYKNTVGVSAVRDLFGTLQNEGASKGILVTTSGYGKSAFEFAEGKPMELLSGSNLLYLLSTHAGIEARIQPPEDWDDPIPS
jgi:restriction system protein